MNALLQLNNMGLGGVELIIQEDNDVTTSIYLDTNKLGKLLCNFAVKGVVERKHPEDSITIQYGGEEHPTLEDVKFELIKNTIETYGTIVKASSVLDISERTIYRVLESRGLSKKDFK